MVATRHIEDATERRLGGQERGSRSKHQFYRQPDGRIDVGPAWLTEEAKLIEEGFQPLRQYGTFWITTNWNEPDGPWTPTIGTAREKFRRLFRLGGAKEFPVWQIIDAGWHVNPPYEGVVFPQLEGVKIAEAMCPSCRERFWSIEGDFPSAQDKLNKHESIKHKEVNRTNMLGRSIAEAQSGAMEQLTGPLAEILKGMQAQMSQQGEILAELMRERRGKRGE